MLLHTVNKSAFNSGTLGDCLRVVAENDAVLLFENGVYGALDNSHGKFSHREHIQKLSASGTRFYILQADCEARGLDASALLPIFTMINDADFVTLAVEASAIQSWY
jgi:tRNA 2-thiouridine synthesizing protein B